MTAEDLMAMKAMSDGTDMSSYEHFMVAEKQQRDPAEHQLQLLLSVVQPC